MNAYFKKIYTASMMLLALLFFSSAFGFPWDSASKKEISWSDNLRQAQELSRQTGKPVLLHFFSDTCPPCKMMEKNTFPNPAIAETVQNLFIPVKLNVKHYPREAQMFNVQGVPMDIVLSPDGQQIQAAVGGQDANRYGQFLATAQNAAKPYMGKNIVDNGQIGTVVVSGRKDPALGNNLENTEQRPENSSIALANSPSNPNAASTAPSLPPMPDFPTPPTNNPLLPGNPPAVPTTIEAGGACPINETPSFNYAAIPEEDKARIEFEGYCPVELGQHSMWVRGDYNNRLLYEGRLYLFAGKNQMEEFRRNPEKYAPAYQGIDIVVLKERGEKVHGVRNYGAWAIIHGSVGRVFLFSSEENLRKFEKDARYYLTPNKN